MHDYCHVEIPATDVQKAAEFYGHVFGWNVHQLHHPDYWGYHTPDGRLLGGITKVDKMPDNSGFQNYVEVPSTLEVIEKARKHGATVVSDRRPVPVGGGFIAVLRSPDGFHFGVFGVE